MATEARLLNCPQCRGRYSYQEERRRGQRRGECHVCGFFFEDFLTRSSLGELEPSSRKGFLRKAESDRGRWVVMDTWFLSPTPLDDEWVEWITGRPYCAADRPAAAAFVTREALAEAVRRHLEGCGVHRAVVIVDSLCGEPEPRERDDDPPAQERMKRRGPRRRHP